MELGTFSISLAVKDIKESRAFYEKFGFKMIAGVPEENWIILGSGEAKIGLFQGMFEKNIMTFNPLDARGIQKELKASGITSFAVEADESTTGPAHFMVSDPDVNTILVDQHV